MKKYVKLISVFLAALMLAMAIPFSVIAKTFITTGYGYNTSVLKDENLLLHLDNLADTENNVSGGAALGSDYLRSSNTWLDGNALKSKTNARGWRAYIRDTGLPLNNDSEYTITYTLEVHENTDDAFWTMIGFCLQDITSSSLTLWKSIHPSSENQIFLAKSASAENSSNTAIGKYTVENTDNFSGSHNYIISIKGTSIVFFRDGIEIAKLGGGLTYSDNNLTVGIHTHGDFSGTEVSETNPFTVFELSNIRVYSGAYADTVTTYTPFENGEELLKLKTPITSTLTDDNYNGSEYEDLTVTQNPNNNVFMADGTSLNNVTNGMTGDDTVYAKKLEAFSGKTYWFEGGVTTNLPLDTGSKYTVEFYMKKHVEALNLGFIFDYVAKNGANQGVYFYENSIATISGTSTQVYDVADSTKKTLSCKNLWTEYQSADGYTRFTLEINGTEVTVFVGGKEFGTFDFGDKFNGSSLALAVKGYVTNTEKVELGSALVSVKDVTVYAGNIESACDVRFENEAGELLNSVKKDPKSVLAATDFPTVEKGENEIVKWFYKGTNIIVNAPYEVTHDTTLVARVIDLDEIRVAGMQYTDMDGDTKLQSVRFISTLHSLQGTKAGYNVRAVYKETEDSAVKADKEWHVESTVVYSSIKATSKSGTVSDVTAEELGGTYLIAIAINKVPAEYVQIDFYVEAYVVVNGETITSDEVRFTISNGEAAELSALEIPQA